MPKRTHPSRSAALIVGLAASTFLFAACDPEPEPGPPVPVVVHTLVGPVATLPGNTGNYAFAGPPALVEVTAATPRVSGAVSSALGLAAGASSQYGDVGLCYRLASGGVLINFVGGQFSQTYFTANRATYAATASAVLQPGSYLAGMCVRNNGGNPISNNNYMNGWLQVTA